MKYLYAIIFLLFSASVSAENWADFDHKTRLGGIYAAVCNICITDGRYHNDSGYWACTSDDTTPNPVVFDCSEAIINAIIGRYQGE